MIEDTIVMELDLPEDLGRDWVWHPDLNVVVFRKGLDCDAQMRAAEDLHRWWQRQHLSVVEDTA